jgi:SAM-dependent methyltransferase
VIAPARASAICHGELPFHNPLGGRAVDGAIALLPLASGDRVLDVGCGRGELLLRIAERTGAGGLGIDAAEEQIAVARAEAEARVPEIDLRFQAGDAADLDVPPERFAAGACFGSTHALGGLDATLARLAALVRPGSYLLVGEGFWAQPPTPAYLAALDATADELADYRALLDAGDPHGLSPVHVATTSPEEWERYEWTYVFNGDRYAVAHPDEDGIELVRERVESVRQRRLLAATHGETLGFALVVWRREG